MDFLANDPTKLRLKPTSLMAHGLTRIVTDKNNYKSVFICEIRELKSCLICKEFLGSRILEIIQAFIF